MGLMYLAFTTDFACRPPFLLMSVIAIGEVGLKEMGMFLMMKWNARSLMITSVPKCSSKALRFPGVLTQDADVESLSL